MLVTTARVFYTFPSSQVSSMEFDFGIEEFSDVNWVEVNSK